MVDKLKAGGYKMVTADRGAADREGAGRHRAHERRRCVGHRLRHRVPTTSRSRLVEIKKQTMPIVSHHVHFFSQKPEEVQAWYVKIFGSKPRAAATNGIIGSDLPGIGLSVSNSPMPVAGTRGRVIDHIGFEVKGLEAFVKKLEAQGIKLDGHTRPCRRSASRSRSSPIRGAPTSS